MSQEEYIDRNGIRITAEDIRAHYRTWGIQTELRNPTCVKVPEDQLDKLVQDTLVKLKENKIEHIPALPVVASVHTVSMPTKLDGSRFGKPWLGAVMSNDPVENERTNEIIRELMKNRPGHIEPERCDDEKLLITLLTKYFGFANYAKEAFRSMLGLVYRNAEHVTVTGRGITLAKDITDYSKCVLHYILTNHEAMGEDVVRFVEEAYKTYTITRLNYGYDIYVDQVEPAVFRVRPAGKNVPTTLTWKQQPDGYSIKRERK